MALRRPRTRSQTSLGVPSSPMAPLCPVSKVITRRASCRHASSIPRLVSQQPSREASMCATPLKRLFRMSIATELPPRFTEEIGGPTIDSIPPQEECVEDQEENCDPMSTSVPSHCRPGPRQPLQEIDLMEEDEEDEEDEKDEDEKEEEEEEEEEPKEEEKEKEKEEDPVVDSWDDLVTFHDCPNCGRTFAADRLPVHINICRRVNKKPTPSPRRRTVKDPVAKHPPSPDDLPPKGTSDTLDAGYGNNSHQSAPRRQSSIRNLHVHDRFAASLIPCPGCGRKFIQKSLEVHLRSCVKDPKDVATVTKSKCSSSSETITTPTVPLPSHGETNGPSRSRRMRQSLAPPRPRKARPSLGVQPCMARSLANTRHTNSSVSNDTEGTSTQGKDVSHVPQLSFEDMPPPRTHLRMPASSRMSRPPPHDTWTSRDPAEPFEGASVPGVAKTRSTIVYREKMEEDTILGEVIVHADTTVAELRSMIEEELGQDPSFQLRKRHIPIREGQFHRLAFDFFRSSNDYAVLHFPDS